MFGCFKKVALIEYRCLFLSVPTKERNVLLKVVKLFFIRFFIVIEKVPAIFQMEELNKSFLISVLLAVEEIDEDLNLEQLS